MKTRRHRQQSRPQAPPQGPRSRRQQRHFALNDIRRYIDYDPTASGPRRVVIRTFDAPEGGIDITDTLAKAIAEEIWKQRAETTC
jgi:hypothetical protein